MDTSASSTTVTDETNYYRHSSFANHVGNNFLMASAAGAGVYAATGFGNAPAAAGGWLARHARAAVSRGPCATAGFIGAYSALLYVFEGPMVAARGGKHDRWNTVAASAAAFSLLHYVPRGGASASIASALLGAAFGGLGADVMTSFSKETPRTSVSSPSITSKIGS